MKSVLTRPAAGVVGPETESPSKIADSWPTESEGAPEVGFGGDDCLFYSRKTNCIGSDCIVLLT